MNNVVFDSFDENVNEIYQVKDQIRNLVKKRQITNNDFSILQSNIKNTLEFWTGCTYVGQPKSPKQEKAFQSFFTELYNLLTSGLVDADRFLYQGTLYRYLGYHSAEGLSLPPVEPKYNDIYVSWSKEPENSYIEGKLCGNITHLTCKVSGDLYGIDLTAFGADCPGEEEVVFPTIESTITDIKIINNEE